MTRDQSLSLPISQLTRKVQNASTPDLTLENLFYLLDSDFRSDFDMIPGGPISKPVCTETGLRVLDADCNFYSK